MIHGLDNVLSLCINYITTKVTSQLMFFSHSKNERAIMHEDDSEIGMPFNFSKISLNHYVYNSSSNNTSAFISSPVLRNIDR